jgi:hypothetical protein
VAKDEPRKSPGGRGFDEPPPESVKTPDDSSEQAAAFDSPGAQEATEEAAASPESSSFTVIPPQLLEVKQAVEQQLEHRTQNGFSVQSAEDLTGSDNIQGVAIGLADAARGRTQATEPGLPTLTLFTAEPTTPDEIQSVVVESFGVEDAARDDVPLSVVTTGIIDVQPHRMRLRPAPGGISISHFAVTAGTLGCLATGRTSPRNSRLLLLSNNHVIANSNRGVYGDCICQPGTYDGGRCPTDQIAILERFVPIQFGGATNYVDCATGWCWTDRVRREEMYISNGTIQYFRINSQPVTPVLGMAVGKSGRTTQLTSGRITQIGATINVNYGVGVALFRDQIAIQAYSGYFSQGGDSGSVVWTWNSYRNPVGLLFAGGGGTTFANPMYRVLPALDINLVT